MFFHQLAYFLHYTDIVEILRISRFVPAGAWLHVARTQYGPGVSFGVHRQDFPEVFWIDSGSGVHLVNGQRVRLNAGDLVVMRPTDRHGFGVVRGQTYSLVNVAFRNESLNEIQQRYHPGGDWPWAGDDLPAQFRVGREGLDRLNAAAEELARIEQSRLALDSFLLEALKVTTAAAELPGDRRPAWLREAVGALERDAALMRGGAAALAAHTHRSPEHLNRVVRRCYGQTTTELINSARLDRSARLLRMSDLPITDVAYESGYENLGYFYRRFAERFATTPRKFRLQAQSLTR